MDGAQRVGFFNIGSGLVFEKILGFGLDRSVEMYDRLFLGIFFTLGYFWVFLGISWYSWVFPGIPVYFWVFPNQIPQPIVPGSQLGNQTRPGQVFITSEEVICPWVAGNYWG